jgi:hypothetical protein
MPHGVVILTATLEPKMDINPVIVRPITDTSLPEPTLFNALGWLSPRLFAVNPTMPGTPRLAATFALFNARTAELRLIQGVRLQVLYTRKTNDDYVPPRILAAQATRLNDNVSVDLSADVEDHEGGIAQVWFTFITPSEIWSVPLDQNLNDPNRTNWQGVTENVPEDARYIVQVVDDAGNVALASGKGDYIPLNIAADPLGPLYLPFVLRN